MKKIFKSSINILLGCARPSAYVQYFRFGYNPTGYLREDISNCVFGTKNIYKHYQAKRIFKALDISSSDHVLDFGCGSGYMSIEIAKLANSTLGVDINPDILNIPIPSFLGDKLQFKLVDKECWWKGLENSFDKILLSEVILSVPNSDELLALCSKLLKEDGKIIVVNGLGKDFIKKFVYGQSFSSVVFRMLYSDMPGTHDAYEERLCSSFGNHTDKLMGRSGIVNLLKSHNYLFNCELNAPKAWIANMLELKQFHATCRGNNSSGIFSFLILRALSAVVNVVQRRGVATGFIGVFSRELI